MTMLQCRCGLRGEYSHVGHALEMCHHTTLVELESAKVEVLAAMASFDRAVDVDKILQLPPNEAAEHFVQAYVKSRGQVEVLNSRERRIMKSGFLRYIALVVTALMLDTLGDVRREEA